MPAPLTSDAGLGSKEDDARLNERISKARSELSELHKIMAKDERERLFRESDGPASRTRSRLGGSNAQLDAKRSAPMDVGYHTPQPLRSASGERLMQLSRTEDGRSDRMRLAELSDEQLKWPTTEKDAAPRS
ncbi:Transcription-associated protein, partial [Phytophthora palmivora]